MAVSTAARHILLCMLWVAMALLGLAAAGLAGVRVLQDAQIWTDWLAQYRVPLLLWRVCLYCATAYGWWWMRRRVLHREDSKESHARLRRVEIAAVISVLAMEAAACVPLIAMR